MTTPSFQSAAALIDAYCQVWCEPNPQRRQQQLSQVWAPQASYTDPTVHASGSEALLAHIAQVQARRPGARVMRTSIVDEHHGWARFAWRAVHADGTTMVDGIDVIEVTPERKIQRVLGFFGALARLQPV